MIKDKIISYVFITLGVFVLHIGFYFFLQPLGLIIGGMMGLSLLIEPYIPLSLGLIYLIANIISLIIGGLIFGKDFFLKTIYATILAPLLVTLFEMFQINDSLLMSKIDMNYQLLVASIAGGVLVGLGIGIVLRYNATTGGMDIYQKMINKYLKVPFSVAVYVTDGLIILFGMFISFQNGLFAVLSMLLTAYMIEKTAVFGRSSFALLIITEKHEEIQKAIFEQIDRGVTRLKAIGGYSGNPKELVITTVTRQELYHAKDFVTLIDPNAFTLIISTKEVLGAGFHRDDIS